MSLYWKAIIFAVAALIIIVFFLFGIGLVGGELLFLKTSPWRWVFLGGDIAGAIASTLLISNLLDISKPGAVPGVTYEEIRSQVSRVSFGLIATAICLGVTTRLLI